MYSFGPTWPGVVPRLTTEYRRPRIRYYKRYRKFTATSRLMSLAHSTVGVANENQRDSPLFMQA